MVIRIKRLFKSFQYALRGLAKVFREEQNLTIQSSAAMLAIIAGLLLGISRLEWCILIFIITLVILMEVANSAVERVTDILKPRIHDYVREIKDIMAAAVMLSAISAIIIGLLIFVPHILRLVGKS